MFYGDKIRIKDIKTAETILLIQRLQRDIQALLQRNEELNNQIHQLEDKLKDLGKNYNGLNKKHQKLLKEIKELQDLKKWGKYYGII